MTDEVLVFENNRTRVFRVRAADGAGGLIRKESYGPDAARRCRHERAILGRLAGVPGVPQLVDGPPDAHSVVLADDDGRPLTPAAFAGPAGPDDLIGLAIELAQVIAALHRRGVVHKDVNPANIVVAGPPMRPVLIDYDLATTFATERPAFTHHTEIAGTLAYLAPEQTGRTGWPVDQRADLYALGATLYELATGTPPFGDGDPLQLVYDHLIRVPAPASQSNPAIPAMLSAIIAHLLEKEPDRRYQSAEGVLHDLRRLRDERARGGEAAFATGERDFPWRLTAPARLVGRQAEIETVRAALAGAIAGRTRAMLVSGAPGVGKTALIDELRPLVTAAGGWFVRGKFDQFRQDPGSDALKQALRGIGRLLLAEPESRLEAVRERLRAAVGANAGLVAAVLPEFEQLLGVAPEAEPDDPLRAQVRLLQSALSMLRALADPGRPLVIVIDDLQWGGAGPIGLIDAVADDESLRGVLVAGAYREAEVDPAHPLAAMLARWGEHQSAPHLRLANLPAAELGVLLAEMLRAPVARADELAEAIRAHSGGNPFDTVEFVNALRRDGALTPADDGWAWDPGAVRRHIGLGDVVAQLTARIDALPGATRDILDVMVCLGNDVELRLLRHAAAPADPAADVEGLLEPALEVGLLVMEEGADPAVRFRHDRVQQAAYRRLDEAALRTLRLAVARRLSAVPGYRLLAAEQYLPVAGELTEPAEAALAVRLLHEAAGHARQLANYPVVERFLAAAAALSDRVPGAGAGLRDALDIERHAALVGLGRFDEADAVWTGIDGDCPDRFVRAGAASIQLASLTARGRPAEAVELGLAVLAGLGHPAPAAEELPGEISRGVDALKAWVNDTDVAADVSRAGTAEPLGDAIAKIINRTIPAAFFCGAPVMAWLVTSAAQMWARRGPSAALVGPVAHAAFLTIGERADYRTGYATVRHVLAVAEALGYEPETSQARFLYALSASPWFDPLEEAVRHAQRAHEGLVRGGDLHVAGFTFFASAGEVFDCAPTLEDVLAEAERGLAFAARTGNHYTAASLVAYRQAARAFRGETGGPGELGDPTFDEAAHVASLAANPTGAGNYHVMGAVVAAVFGDQAALTEHSAAAIACRPAFDATHLTTTAHLVRGLALAGQAAAAPAADRAALLAEFGWYRDWMADRAAEAPGNFGHLREWLDAERAWATGDFEGAVRAFDAAQHETEARQRPWQRAYVAERRGRFHLAQGVEHAARQGLHDARRHYESWGAAGKVAELDREFPFLLAEAEPAGTARRTVDARRSSSISSDMIDALALLRASQALSSETSVTGLQRQVGELLCALTGATSTRMLLWDPEAAGWFLPPCDESGGRALPVDQAAAAGLIPLSVFRYTERTREPLLVDDAVRDDRFAADPYLRPLAECALMAVPILTRGALSAMLILENRRSRGAFGANRLGAVELIAGQLSVSLDNALLYAALERRVADRTEALKAANDKLEQLSVTDPLTGLPNRRRLSQMLDMVWQQGPTRPVAVAMVDVDHFKLYNDHYGHQSGDECLRKVAQAIGGSLRDTDLVARYGGEEFAIVLPGADGVVAARVGERVRAAVAALAVPHEPAGHKIVTVSIGIAVTLPTPLSTAEQLIKSADAELYEAKRGGRNRVSIAAQLS